MAENPFAAPAEIRPAPGGLISVEQQRAVAEVQARMLIARANPRDEMRATDRILQDCTRLSLAERALYQYARGGTDISGPSIKLAETMAQRWGNIASGVKEIERRDGYSACVAYAWDLESGYYDERQFQVRHWRDTKQGGYRVTDERDIYEMIANMGQRRKRAVLLAVIPGDVVEAATQQCEETLHTKADTSPEAIRKMADAFAALGVTKEQIETKCQRRLEAIRPAQIVMLRRIYASLKDEMSSTTDWFAASPSEANESLTTGNQALRARLAARAPAVGQDEPIPDEASDIGPPAEDPAEAAPEAEEPHPVDDPPDRSRVGTGRSARPPPESEPTEQQIERSQDMLAAVLGPDELAQLDEQSLDEIEVIKPQRLPRGRGWDWPLYADELIAAGLRTSKSHLGRFRGANASMFDVLRNSNREQWERVNRRLAEHEREGTQQ